MLMWHFPPISPSYFPSNSPPPRFPPSSSTLSLLFSSSLLPFPLPQLKSKNLIFIQNDLKLNDKNPKSIFGFHKFRVVFYSDSPHHNLPALVQIVKNTRNRGKRFNGCPLWKSNECSFFKWEHKELLEEKERIKAEKEELRAEVYQLRAGNEQLEQQLSKMIEEKRLVEEVLTMMRKNRAKMEEDAMKSAQLEKLVFRAIILCMLMIAIVLGVWKM